MRDNKLKTDSTNSRRFFLKSAFFWGLPIVSHSFFALLVPKSDSPVTSYTRVSGCPGMGKSEFDSLKGTWIDSHRFTKTVQAFHKKGLILSFKKTDDINSTTVNFVFASAEAKKNFDSYLVTHKIFREKNLLDIGLTHETGIS